MDLEASFQSLPTLGSNCTLGATSLSSGDHPDLSSWWGISGDGSGLAGMLVPSSPVRVGSRYHFLTTSRWPDTPARPHELLDGTGLQEVFLGSSSSSYNPDHGSTLVVHVDRLSGWQAKFGALRSMRHDHAVRSRSSCQATTITWTQFHITNQSPFRHSCKW